MTRGPDVPDVVLERHRLGELPAREAEALARRAEAEEGIRERLEALARSDAEIRRLHPADRLAEQVRARLGTGRPATPLGPRARYWPVPIALAAAVVLFAVLRPVAEPPLAPSAAPSSADGADDRIKGLKPSLAVFRRRADHSEALADGDMARAGDLIRLGYRAAGRRFGVILSLDGRGHVTVHLPRQGARAAALEAAPVVLLDHAYELDDAPRWERFFLVTSETPFDLATVVDGARRTPVGATPPAALALPSTLEQAAFSLEKEVRP
jgi:hypothetical protein